MRSCWLQPAVASTRMTLTVKPVVVVMAGEKEGWAKLAKNLKAEIDEEAMQA